MPTLILLLLLTALTPPALATQEPDASKETAAAYRQRGFPAAAALRAGTV